MFGKLPVLSNTVVIITICVICLHMSCVCLLLADVQYTGVIASQRALTLICYAVILICRFNFV